MFLSQAGWYIPQNQELWKAVADGFQVWTQPEQDLSQNNSRYSSEKALDSTHSIKKKSLNYIPNPPDPFWNFQKLKSVSCIFSFDENNGKRNKSMVNTDLWHKSLFH